MPPSPVNDPRPWCDCATTIMLLSADGRGQSAKDRRKTRAVLIDTLEFLEQYERALRGLAGGVLHRSLN